MKITDYQGNELLDLSGLTSVLVGNGWTAYKYPNGYVEMTKIISISGSTANIAGNIYRILGSDVTSFPVGVKGLLGKSVQLLTNNDGNVLGASHYGNDSLSKTSFGNIAVWEIATQSRTLSVNLMLEIKGKWK